MRILLVKLSSLGDVVHNFPVARDLRRAFPDATIDWVTEAAYAPLVRLHPDIQTVFTVHLRALKKAWWRPSNWWRFFDEKKALNRHRFDLILDSQGLLKSALVAHWANGPVAGFDQRSAREPMAARWYQHTSGIDRQNHAVRRNRALAAAALRYDVPPDCDYGFTVAPAVDPRWASDYVVFLHATSRADKCWPVESWIKLGRACHNLGWRVVVLAGNAAEFARSTEIITGITNTAVAIGAADATDAIEPMPLPQTAAILSGAKLVVGVDTGLVHLAVALKRPAIGIFLTTQPGATGLYAGETNTQNAVNLGGGSRDQPAVVTVDKVIDAVANIAAGAH